MGNERDPQKPGNIARVRTVATKYWRPAIAVILALAAVSVIILVPQPLRKVASFVSSHLPLSLPILMVVVSIGVRIHELNSSRGWLGLCNYFAAGYVTFAIWALVSGESVLRFIWINDEKVLDKSYSVLLVITAFGLLAVCSLVTVLAERQSNPGDTGNKRRWQFVQASLVAVSLFALLFPYVLFEDKATVEERTGRSLELRSFTVSIGYRDPSFNQYLGRSANPIQQCAIFRSVAAKTPEEAKKAALKSFMDSEVSNQFISSSDRLKNRPTKQVEIERTWIVAESDTGGS